MIIYEKETNIKEVCYSDFGSMFFPLVKCKMISDYFFSNDCMLVSVAEDKVFEAYKVFQYDFSKANETTLSYSIFEFRNGRKKEFIVRIIEWDRIKAKERISETLNKSEMELNSEVYYINGNSSAKMKLLLRTIRSYFKKELIFKKVDTVKLNSKIYIDYSGFSKTIQWVAPFSEQKTEVFLDKVITEIYSMISDLGRDVIPKQSFFLI